MKNIYRKLTANQIVALANKIKFSDKIDFDQIRQKVSALYGPTAHMAVLNYSSEYNDSEYDNRVNSVIVLDIDGHVVPFTDDISLIKKYYHVYSEDKEEIISEGLSNFQYDLTIEDVGNGDETGDIGEVVIFIDPKLQDTIELPDLYIKE